MTSIFNIISFHLDRPCFDLIDKYDLDNVTSFIQELCVYDYLTIPIRNTLETH
jgi:hypothetical protein